MANSIDYASVLTPELDKIIVREAATSFLIDEKFKAKFVGAKNVLIPDVDMSGLGTYSRSGGYPTGSVTVDQKTYSLSMDRGARLNIDAQDADESGVADLAAQTAAELVRTKAIPEMDAYGLSKIAKVASDKSHTVAMPTGGTLATKALYLLQKAISEVRNIVGYSEELVAFMNNDYSFALNTTSEISRYIGVQDFQKGGVNTRVKVFDDCKLIPVGNDRMKSAYTFKPGTADDGFGFAATTAAKDVNLIVMPRKAVKLIKKTADIKHFAPKENQNMDAHQIDYRLYYDFLIKNSMAGTIYAYIAA